MTKLKFTDERLDITPIFGDLAIGDSFTSVGDEIPFIKTTVMYDEHKDPYNTISLDGEFYWCDDDEEVTPIRELEVIIKK